jgi:hypothetical protein
MMRTETVINNMIKHRNFMPYLGTKLKINISKTTKDIWEAFKITTQHFDPVVKDEHGFISLREASKILGGEISKDTLSNKAKAGVLRSSEKGLYVRDIENMAKILNVKNLFIQEKVIGNATGIKNEKYIYYIPEKISKLGKSKTDQMFEAVAQTLLDPFVLAWIEEMKPKK